MNRKVLIYSILFFLPSSCIKEIKWQGQNESSNTLVIEGLITNLEENQSIKITRTMPVISNKNPEMVSGANVMVSDGENNFQFEETEPGIYHSIDIFQGVVNKTYKLFVVLEGEEYSAVAKMEEAPDIEPIKIETGILPSEPGTVFALGEELNSFTLPGNFGAEKPYKYKLTYVLPQNPYKYYPSDWEAPEWYINSINDNDTIIIDTTFYVHTVLEPAALLIYGEHSWRGMLKGSTIREYVYSMTEEHYEYIRAVLSETDWRGIGVVGNIPADVPTNLTNGAKGFFAASEIKIMETIVIE